MYTAYWVNPDGSHPKTTLAYISSPSSSSSSSSADGALLLTGDIDAYVDTEAHVVEAVSRFCLSDGWTDGTR